MPKATSLPDPLSDMAKGDEQSASWGEVALTIFLTNDYVRQESS